MRVFGHHVSSALLPCGGELAILTTHTTRSTARLFPLPPRLYNPCIPRYRSLPKPTKPTPLAHPIQSPRLCVIIASTVHNSPRHRSSAANTVPSNPRSSFPVSSHRCVSSHYVDGPASDNYFHFSTSCGSSAQTVPSFTSFPFPRRSQKATPPSRTSGTRRSSRSKMFRKLRKIASSIPN